MQAGNISAGAVGSSQLASGAAVADLQASGQSGVASGGVILSTNLASIDLINAGYTRIGKTAIGEVWDPRPSGSPRAGRYYHTAIWTGSELIIWGGTDGTNYFNDGGR